MTYNVGDVARLTVAFTDVNGAPANPSTVTLTVTAPDQTVTVYTNSSNPPVVNDSVGNFHCDIPALLSGIYYCAWQGLGTVQAVADDFFTVATLPPSGITVSPINLCRLDDVREALLFNQDAATGNVSDRTLLRMITACSQFVLTRTGRTSFLAQSFTERRNGTGTYQMVLKQSPIVSVSSVVVDGAAVPQSPDGVQSGWMNDTFSVYLIGAFSSGGWGLGSPYPVGVGNVFRRGIMNVLFTYSAGYSSVPADIEQAVIEAVSQKYRRRSHVDEDSQVLNGSQTISFSRTDFPREALSAIDQYKYRAPVLT